MIDLSQLTSNPANQIAANFLRESGLVPDSAPLLQMVNQWFETTHPEFSEYQWEAEPLWSHQPLENQYALLVGDWETLHHELSTNQPLAATQILVNHLNQLASTLRTAKNPLEAERLLAENLMLNLAHQYPSFGPQAP